MQIRQEDKELINYLRLLGAGLGAILAVLTVFHFHNNAKNQLSQQRHYVQQNSPLAALANLNLIGDSGGKNNIAGEFLDNVKQDNAELTRLEKGFWANLSMVDLTVLSAIACVGGLIGGFYSVWLISALGTMGIIQLVRLTYKIIWRIKPDFDGGKQQIQDGTNVLIKRDKHRLLSGVLKMSVIALICLTVLWLAVYYFTG
jgi:hypothetical protein